MAKEESITILFYVTAKEGKEEEFRELAAEMTKTTREEDEGCIHFTYHQEVDNPRQFVLYERWRDRAALDAHLARLQEVYGPPPSGGFLPAALLDFWEEEFKATPLQVIA